MAVVSVGGGGGEQEECLQFGLRFGILSCFIVVVGTVIVVGVMLISLSG